MGTLGGTRLRILQLLQRHGESTVDALARALGMATTSIRRHLDLLQRDHLVAFREARKRTGRPEHVFCLTEQGQEALPKGYVEFLDRFIEHLLQLQPQDLHGADGQAVASMLLERMARSMAGTGALASARSQEERLAALRALLMREQFAPEVVQQGPQVAIELHNCPFRAVARTRQFMCQLDQRLISLMLNAPVRRQRWMFASDHTCCYVAGPDAALDDAPSNFSGNATSRASVTPPGLNDG